MMLNLFIYLYSALHILALRLLYLAIISYPRQTDIFDIYLSYLELLSIFRCF